MATIARQAMDENDLILAGSMFKELAQYVAPKRKSIEMTGDVNLDVYSDIMVGFRDVAE